jgi:hypothetical protein
MSLAGSMRLAVLRFRALAETPGYGTPLAFAFMGERTTAVAYRQLPLDISTANGFVAVEPVRTLIGLVGMQGSPNPPDPSWAVPLILTVHDMDDPEPLAVYAVTTDEGGRFVVPGLPAGTYDLKIKGLHTLRNAVTSVTITDRPNMVFMGILREGDASNDNIINAMDLAIYAASAGKSSGQPGFDPRADFSEDGVVNHADLALLAMNFGLAGDVEVGLDTGAGAALGRSAAVLADGSLIDLSLLPLTNPLSVGQIFTLAVQVQGGSQPVHALELHIDLPAGLAVVAPDGTPVEAIDSSGVLPVVVLNHADNSTGVIDFAATYDATPPTVTFTVAMTRLKTLTPLATVPVRFARYASRMDVVYEGTVTLLSGNAVGLTFRSSTDGTSSYDVILDAVQNLFKVSKRSPYHTLDSYPVTVQYNHPYQLKVVANGATIDAYLDGVLRIEITDSTYSGGRFRVMLHMSAATYDDLSGWDLP